MKRLAAVLVIVVVGCSLASAQSLAEVAEKEKQRRARTEDADTAEVIPVIDDLQLSQSQGDHLSVMGVEPPDESARPDDAGVSEPPDAVAAKLSDAEIREYRDTWARVWAERLEAAEQELELARDAVFQCQSAAHYVYVPLAIDCNRVYERRAIAEYVLKETRQNRFNWELLLPETKRPPPQP